MSRFRKTTVALVAHTTTSPSATSQIMISYKIIKAEWVSRSLRPSTNFVLTALSLLATTFLAFVLGALNWSRAVSLTELGRGGRTNVRASSVVNTTKQLAVLRDLEEGKTHLREVERAGTTVENKHGNEGLGRIHCA